MSSFEYHKSLLGTDLHIPKLHAPTHYPSGTDPLDLSLFGFVASGMSSTDLQSAIEEAFRSGGTNALWGHITGSLTDQTDLQSELKRLETLISRENLWDIDSGTNVLRPTFTGSSLDMDDGNITTTGDIRLLSDSSKLELGGLAGGDLQAYHNGTNSYIDNNTGDFYIRNRQGVGGDLILSVYENNESDTPLIKLDGELLSFASGYGTVASGANSTSMGEGVTTSGEAAFGMGSQFTNSTDNSIAFGINAIDLLITAGSANFQDTNLTTSGDIRLVSDSNRLELGASATDLSIQYDGTAGVFTNADVTTLDADGKLQFYADYTPTSGTGGAVKGNYFKGTIDLSSINASGNASYYCNEFEAVFELSANPPSGVLDVAGTKFTNTFNGNYSAGFSGAWSGNLYGILNEVNYTGSFATIAGANFIPYSIQVELSPTALPSSQLKAIESTVVYNSTATINQLYGWYHTLEMQNTGNSGSMHGFFTTLKCTTDNTLTTEARCYSADFDNTQDTNFNTALGVGIKYVGFQALDRRGGWAMADKDSYGFHSTLVNNARNFSFVSDGADGWMAEDNVAWKFGATKTDLDISSDGINGVITTNAALLINSTTVDITSTTDPQLRLTHTDGVDETDFYTNSDGELEIMPTARTIYLGDGTAGDATFGFYGNTSVYTLIHDDSEGDLKVSANDTTNYTQFEADGDLIFVGTAGLPYGDLYVHGNTTGQTISTATLTQVTTFDTAGESNLTTPNHTTDDITISKAGRYLITMSSSFSGDPNVTWLGGVYKNNGATQLSNLQTKRKLGAGGDVGSVSISGIVSLSANDTIEVWFQHAEGVDKSITVAELTLSVVMVGGG